MADPAPNSPDISIRGGAPLGAPGHFTPPRYPLNCDGNIDTPLDKVQMQYQGFSASTWQTILANVLPYARQYGMPGEQEIPPGLSNPLNPEERAALIALLAAP